MTDNDLILKGCVAEYNQVIYRLCCRFQADSAYIKANIRNKQETEILIADLRGYIAALEEVTNKYHSLCPPLHPQSPTAD